MPDEPDADLLRRFVRGEMDAFEALFKRFERDVYRWAVRIVRDPAAADDIVIESFWRAYRGRARFDPSRSIGAWLRRIATNAARDHLRARRRRGPVAPTPQDLAAPPTGDRAVRETVVLAFRTLPPKLHIVATLALIEGLEYAEIADALDVPIGTVKSRLFRAIRALRAELGRLGVEP